MKKNLLLFYLFVLPAILFGQSKNIVVNWYLPSTKPVSTVSKVALPTGNSTKRINELKLQLSDDTQQYQEQWRDNIFADEKSLQVSNIVYGTLTSEELKLIDTKRVPSQLKYSLNSSAARDVIYTIFTISPVINENGAFKKVLSCRITYNQKSFSQNGGNRMQLTNSVLASGNWYKFKIEQTGIHRIDKSFLDAIGMNTNGINPRNIKIYGHGGQTLPLLNAANAPIDIPEIAIQVVGEEDSSFDNGDGILFYATSTKGYVPENDSNINPYSDDSYYYITADGGSGLRLQPMQEPTGAATTNITQFNDYQFHEIDESSPGRVGRRWFGNRFDIQNEQSFEFTFPNIVVGQPMEVKIKAIGVSDTPSSIATTLNGAVLNPINLSAIPDNSFLSTGELLANVPAASETIAVDLAYNNGGNPSGNAFLDYISISALRQLTGVDGQLSFQFNAAETLFGIGEYQLTNASQFNAVWDVTNPAFVTSKANDGNNAVISFKSNLGEIRKYVAVNPSNYFVPTRISQAAVVNQNLKGTIFNNESGNFEDLEYLIITSPFLLQPALRLANFHKNQRGLNVKVVTTDKIYQEFSSGKQDISAIRNFVRYVYSNASTPNNRVKYLCLFGDSSVDYKNRLPNNNNTVPSFHTLSSGSSVTSFVSDDFFGNMDSNEGTIGMASGDIDKLDIAAGRIVADEVGLANAMVDKILNYASKASYGNWRNNFVLISDDVDEEFEYNALEVNLDRLGDEIAVAKPFINVKKIHTDAFQQETSAGGNRYPQVVEAIQDNIEVGALVVNYFGHGGEDGLAKEFIYTKDVAQNLRNKNRYPCIVTVTCEFTRFDNPTRETAGELTFWNREGGALSLVTTTRSITVSLGVAFNDSLAAQLFGFNRNIPNPPAEALRISKNQISNNLRRVIFYIGDPALPLAFPKKEVRLTTLNGIPMQQATDTLKALSRIRLGGEVVDENGILQSNYNGIIETKVFDKKVQRQTLGNDGVSSGGQLLILNFETLGEGLFNGQATVTNGLFEVEFVVPRDIQIPVGNGRVSFYSQKNNEFEDQAGFNTDILVGGLNENAPEDNQGPLVKLFMNDESFVSGGVTNNSPNLIVKLEDENGINTASGIGHDIVAVLDGDESNPFILNEFYQAEVDDFTRGATNYKFRDLEDGLHTLTLKAWDVYNNSSTQELQFVVAGSDELVIERVLNYPNPFVNYTEFWFSHNRANEEFLDVQIQIFTVTGKVVRTLGGTYATQGANLMREITWDGRDDFGDKIGKGVYVYKITVKSSLTNQQVEKFEKLVIL